MKEMLGIAGLLVAVIAAVYISAGTAQAHRDAPTPAFSSGAVESLDCVTTTDVDDSFSERAYVGMATVDGGTAQEVIVTARNTTGGDNCRLIRKTRTRVCETKIDPAGNYARKCGPWSPYQYTYKCE